jgi:predicted trehalose synthase
MLGIVAQVSSERAHEGAGKIQAEAGAIGAALERLKEPLAGRDAGSRVGEANGDAGGTS